MPDPDDVFLGEATTDQLLLELGKRFDAVVLAGYRHDDPEIGDYVIYRSRGSTPEKFGLIELMKDRFLEEWRETKFVPTDEDEEDDDG